MYHEVQSAFDCPTYGPKISSSPEIRATRLLAIFEDFFISKTQNSINRFHSEIYHIQ
jgi:hypothetical protein